MKRLPKLLALVLTGVMALTLLAGCSGGVALSEKEILENFKDFYKVEVYPIEFTDDTTNYAQKAANAVKVYYNGLAEEKKAEFDVEELIDSIAEFNDPAGVCDAVVPNGSSVAFELTAQQSKTSVLPISRSRWTTSLRNSFSMVPTLT